MEETKKEPALEAPVKTPSKTEQFPLAEEEYNADEVFEATEYEDEAGIKHINEYEKCEKLGNGSYGKVFRVIRSFYDEDGKIAKASYAMKIFHKPTLMNQRFIVYESEKQEEAKMTTYLEQVYNEIEVWRRLEHKNLIKLYQIIDDPDNDRLFLVMQLGDLGQLMHWDEDLLKYHVNLEVFSHVKKKLRLSERNLDTFQEKELVAKYIFKEIGEAVQYLHVSKGISHRDIKLDNIICKSDDESFIKLCDFTTAKKFEDGQKFYDIAGTAGFRAPELMFTTAEGYSPEKCDIWSLGVCLYTFLLEEMPFFSATLSEIEIDLQAKSKILQYPKHFSESLVDLLGHLLEKVPAKRFSIKEYLSHGWFI